MKKIPHLIIFSTLIFSISAEAEIDNGELDYSNMETRPCANTALAAEIEELKAINRALTRRVENLEKAKDASMKLSSIVSAVSKVEQKQTEQHTYLMNWMFDHGDKQDKKVDRVSSICEEKVKRLETALVQSQTELNDTLHNFRMKVPMNATEDVEGLRSNLEIMNATLKESKRGQGQMEDMLISTTMTTHHLAFLLKQDGMLNATSSFKYSKISQFPPILELIIRPTQTCGGNFSDLEGSFATPNYPNNYNANETCIWILNVPAGYMSIIMFHHLETEWANCIYDFLDITSLANRNEGALVCGRIQPYYHYVAHGPTMFKFQSDNRTQMSGFYATFFSYKSVK